MNNLPGFVKKGWHPKGKDGGQESWRGDFKGINQVAGWMGKGKDTTTSTSDRDTSKMAGWMEKGKDAGASGISQVAGWMGKGEDKSTSTYNRSEHVSRPLSSLKDPASFGPPPKHVKYHGAVAPTNEGPLNIQGRGAPLSREQSDDRNTQQQAGVVEEKEPARASPPVPYRADRTGLSTNNLPPPPTRGPKPSIPPRIPPRQATVQPAPEHSSEGYLNERAISNLSREGVCVPTLGIEGNRGSDGRTSSTGNAPERAREPAGQSSFSSTSSRSYVPSMSSINSFRERHSDQIQAGKQKISGINEKYGISRRINGFIEDQKSGAGRGPPSPQPNEAGSNAADMAALNRKKAPPPPPPPKRQEIRASPVGTGPAPPPVPLGTKPR